MTIKTITTVDGINVADFGNTINKYYWFKNLGGSTVCVYLFLFGKSKGDIFLAFEETGTGCAYIHPAYYYQMFYSAGSNTIYSSANTSNYNAVAKGHSKKYYLKPLIIGSAVLYGLLVLDGGVTTNNFSGDFKFNGKDYWGFAYSNSGNNFVLKL